MSDIYLIPTADGGEISVADGKPLMTSGLETAVYLSLFTQRYWGNVVSDISQRYTSRIPELMNRPLTNQTRLAMIDAAKLALQWMLDEGAVDTIEVDAQISAKGRLDIRVTLNEPDTEGLVYALNWESQQAELSNRPGAEPIVIERYYKFALGFDDDDILIADDGAEIAVDVIVKETL